MIRFAPARELRPDSVSAQFAEMALIYDTRALDPETRADVQARQNILIQAEAAYHQLVREQERAKEEAQKVCPRERIAELKLMKQAQYMRRKSLQTTAYHKHGLGIKYGNNHRTGIETQINDYKRMLGDID